MQQFLHRPIDARLLVVYVDAIFLGSHAILVAPGAGRKQVLGMHEGSTENAAVTVALLEDLMVRGPHACQGLLFVVDGPKAIAALVAQVLAERALVQRCQGHYADGRCMRLARIG